MSAVFLDTVGLLALWDIRDQWHEPAQAAFDRMREEGAGVITTIFIIAECGNATSRTAARNGNDTTGSRKTLTSSRASTQATLRDPDNSGLPKLLSGELSLASATASMEAGV